MGGAVRLDEYDAIQGDLQRVAIRPAMIRGPIGNCAICLSWVITIR
jgi:hypothetical protein